MSCNKNEKTTAVRKTILYFGNEWGADNRTSSHHIARRLMQDYNVIYIESPGLRAPQLTKRDITKIFRKIFQIFRKRRQINDQSFVKTLYQIPFHSIPLIKHLNKALILWQVKKIYRDNNLVDPILWFVVPHVAYIPEAMNSSCSVYYCVDDFTELPGVNKRMITEMDNKLCNLCDLVFVISEPLLEKKKMYGNKVHLSKHGVDFDHFYSAVGRKLEIPERIKNIESPVIGFFGLIEEWIDLQLIEYLAKKRPEWNFLLIGRVAVDKSAFDAIENVHFIGSVEYEALPSYSQTFDVALIPVKMNELIRNFNPLKLREYLAMGLPIVSVYFPELEQFADYVYIANSKDEFLESIQKALDDNNDDLAEKRARSVQGSSWDSRYNEVKSIVASNINS